jgi:hypothetical protein
MGLFEAWKWGVDGFRSRFCHLMLVKRESSNNKCFVAFSPCAKIGCASASTDVGCCWDVHIPRRGSGCLLLCKRALDCQVHHLALSTKRFYIHFI